MSKKHAIIVAILCGTMLLCSTLGFAQAEIQEGIVGFSLNDSGAPVSVGLLDSLVAGSAVGTLLGHDFTGFGIIDMAVAAVLLYLMFKLILFYGLSAHEDKTHTLDPNHTPDEDDPKRAIKMQAQNAWARLRSESENKTGGSLDSSADNSTGQFAKALTDPKGDTPLAGFDRDDFLDGAKLLYTRLQKAWAARELGQLKDFITPDMLAVLSEHAEQHPEKTSIDVVLVSPTLIDVTSGEEGSLHAKVLFSALISEEGAQHPVETKEIWYFVFEPARQTTWQLDGIEPVANNTV